MLAYQRNSQAACTVGRRLLQLTFQNGPNGLAGTFPGIGLGNKAAHAGKPQ